MRDDCKLRGDRDRAVLLDVETVSARAVGMREFAPRARPEAVEHPLSERFS